MYSSGSRLYGTRIVTWIDGVKQFGYSSIVYSTLRYHPSLRAGTELPQDRMPETKLLELIVSGSLVPAAAVVFLVLGEEPNIVVLASSAVSGVDSFLTLLYCVHEKTPFTKKPAVVFHPVD